VRVSPFSQATFGQPMESALCWRMVLSDDSTIINSTDRPDKITGKLCRALMQADVS
jgi:hypothetical protein